MHDPRKLREEAQEYRRRLRRRGADGLLDEALKVDEDRLSVLRRVEELRAERNRASQEIAGLRKAGKDAQAEIERMRGVGEELKAKEAELAELEGKVQELWLQIPNVPSDDMPDGLEPREERVVFERPRFGFEPKAHWEIGTNLGILDFDRATRMSGSRFALQRGLGAKLERALIDFMIDVHTSRGYTEIFPPFLVQEPALYGTGQLPKFREEMFQTQTGHFLISTAEVPVTNMHREEILPDDELPIRYCAYSACFRAEAGAAGRDTRGLIRLHQFNKVEIVHFVRPEESDRELDLIVDEAEEILRRLELHYRVVTLPTMDYGFSAYKTLDLEVWLPSQDMFR